MLELLLGDPKASKRVLGISHFDVRLIGVMVMHCSQIAERNTSEVETQVATRHAHRYWRIDEVTSLPVGEARTSLIISGQIKRQPNTYRCASEIPTQRELGAEKGNQ